MVQHQTRMALVVCALVNPVCTMAEAQDLSDGQVLFNAQTRSFALQSDGRLTDLGSNPIEGWTASGMDAATALDLGTLMSIPDQLNEEDAARLQAYTVNGAIGLGGNLGGDPANPDAIVVPLTDPPVIGGGQTPIYTPPVPQTCRNGTQLPSFCDDPERGTLPVCTCN